MVRPVLVGALLLTALATSASAQDVSQFAGLFAAGTQAFGESIGEAAVSGPSIFVTATGRAQLPAPITDAYFINIEGQSPSAVEASRLRDERLKSARAIAQRFNVSVQVGSSSFSREADRTAQDRRNREFQAQLATHPATPPMFPNETDVDRVFVARTGVRFLTSEASQLPAFLDALKAAGIDDLSGNLGLTPPSLIYRNTEVLGFGNLARVDEAIWDRASQDAIEAARRQAKVLASAAGRQIGDVKQILFLTRNIQGSEVSVTVAARFGFLPAK